MQDAAAVDPAHELRDARVPAAQAARQRPVRRRDGPPLARRRPRRGARLRRRRRRRDRDAASPRPRPGRRLRARAPAVLRDERDARTRPGGLPGAPGIRGRPLRRTVRVGRRGPRTPGHRDGDAPTPRSRRGLVHDPAARVRRDQRGPSGIHADHGHPGRAARPPRRARGAIRGELGRRRAARSFSHAMQM